jgi:hypothetical protein
VVIDCNDFEAMWRFWAAALGYEPKYPVEDDWVILADPQERGVQVSFQLVPEPRAGKNRLHLDLYTREPAAEVERLVGLGARRQEPQPEGAEDFVVLEDPEGNLFCVVDAGADG